MSTLDGFSIYDGVSIKVATIAKTGYIEEIRGDCILVKRIFGDGSVFSSYLAPYQLTHTSEIIKPHKDE